MPIPGPPPPPAPPHVHVPPTGSPFWLRLNGEWVWLEGVLPGVGVDSERPGSQFVSLEGRRYTQRAQLARRSWSLSYRYATPLAVAALMAAAESDEEVWLSSDSALSSNMLARADSFGTGTVLDCAGLPLRTFGFGTTTITVRVRRGVPVTLSAWTDPTLAEGATFASFDPGDGLRNMLATAGDRASQTFIPTADSFDIAVSGFSSAGWMLTEGAEAPEAFAAGEGMPCPVVVDEPDETLTMHHGGHYRHDYAITLREVG